MIAPSPPHYLLFAEASQHEEQPGKWRFVLENVAGGGKMVVVEREPRIRGQRLELLAVVRGLEALDQPSRVTLITASRYVTRGIRIGIHQWRESGWQWERFGQMTPIRDVDLWRRIHRTMQFHQIECRNWRFDAGQEAVPGPHFGRNRHRLDEIGSHEMLEEAI